MIKYTHVIWDFNGTVLSDMEIGMRATNAMLEKRGLALITSLAHYRSLFDFPVEDYYRRLGLDLEREDYKTVLAPEWVARYNAMSDEAKLFPGVATLARALRRHGVSQSILSASEKHMMEQQLLVHGALSWFDEIWGTDTIHAYGKMALADAWREAHKGAHAVLVGDTTHDFEVAQCIGADCILVAAGHHSEERLLACGVPVVQDLEECARLLGV